MDFPFSVIAVFGLRSPSSLPLTNKLFILLVLLSLKTTNNIALATEYLVGSVL